MGLYRLERCISIVVRTTTCFSGGRDRKERTLNERVNGDLVAAIARAADRRATGTFSVLRLGRAKDRSSDADRAVPGRPPSSGRRRGNRSADGATVRAGLEALPGSSSNSRDPAPVPAHQFRESRLRLGVDGLPQHGASPSQRPSQQPVAPDAASGLRLGRGPVRCTNGPAIPHRGKLIPEGFRNPFFRHGRNGRRRGHRPTWRARHHDGDGRRFHQGLRRLPAASVCPA